MVSEETKMSDRCEDICCQINREHKPKRYMFLREGRERFFTNITHLIMPTESRTSRKDLKAKKISQNLEPYAQMHLNEKVNVHIQESRN